MLEGDWVEHWMSGGVGDHGPNGDGYHAMVRSEWAVTCAQNGSRFLIG